MPLTAAALDRFVAQEISKLDGLKLESLASVFPERSHWLDQFVLKRILNNHVRDEHAALAIVIIRRADAAIDEWELAAKAVDRIQRPSVYFKVLRHLESCLSALWQGLEFGRRALDLKLFENDDASVYQRLNWVYNVSRHFKPETLPTGDLHRVWITNEGLHTREHAITFRELRDVLQMFGRVAGRLSGNV
jgi:hypothetical protein